MESCTISPISFRYPLVKVIRSKDSLLTLELFHDPIFFGPLVCLMRNIVISRSTPPFSISSFASSSVSGEGDFFLLELCSSPPTCPTYPPTSCMASNFVLALASISFFLFMAKCSIFSLASSFFCYVVVLLDPVVKSKIVCHSPGQLSRTT